MGNHDSVEGEQRDTSEEIKAHKQKSHWSLLWSDDSSNPLPSLPPSLAFLWSFKVSFSFWHITYNDSNC